MEIEQNVTENSELLKRLSSLESKLSEMEARSTEQVKQKVNEPVEPAEPQVDLFDEYCKEHYDKRRK